MDFESLLMTFEPLFQGDFRNKKVFLSGALVRSGDSADYCMHAFREM